MKGSNELVFFHLFPKMEVNKRSGFSYLELILFLLEYLYDRFLRLIFGATPLIEEENAGKVVLVTGANSGLGKVASLEFAKRGMTVIMACRNLKQGAAAAQEIKNKTGSKRLVLRHLDLADLDSVRKLAQSVSKEFPRIHILLNNAGIYSDADTLKQTKDGFEMHMGVNHLGHFLLTNLLLDNVKRAAPSRIVTLASTNQLIADLDISDIMMKNSPDLGFQNSLPYNNSKYANSLFTMELAKRLEGTNVNCYALCPGLVNTQVFRSFSPFRKFYTNMNLFIAGCTPEQGCETILYCALSKEVAHESGLTYRFCKHFSSANKRLDGKKAAKLWDISEALVDINNSRRR